MNILSNFHLSLLAGTALCLLSLPAAAQAEEGEAAATADPTEIIVTAQRRPERIQSTPIAIAAFDGEFIERTRLDDVKALVTYSPGFSGDSQDSYIDGLAIRGIVSNDYGIGGDPSIGIFKDGVHQGRSGAAVTSLFDIERAETLRGPQGFLFGRNAISGAISVITRKPELDRTGGYAEASYGEVDRFELQGALNLPLSSHWALRLAGYALRSDGWIDNAFTPGIDDRLMGEHKSAGRAALRFRNGDLDLVVTAEHERRRLDGTPYRGSNADREVLDYLDAALGTELVIRGGPRSVDSDLVDPRDDGSITSLTARADWELGFATLTSITGYRRHHFFYSEDSDATPLPFATYRQWQSGDYASQELRLISPGGGRLTWSAGASAYREHVRARYINEADESFVCRAGYGYEDCEALTQDLYGARYSPTAGGLLVDENRARNHTVGLSAFGDANFRPVETLQLGAGLRYSWDRKQMRVDIPPVASSLGNIWSFTYYTDGAIRGARSWGGFTPRLFLRYEPGRRLSLYASVTRGYKAGGFGSFTVEAPSAIPDYGPVPPGTRPDAFAPETVWSKEIGAKGSLLDRRLSFDIAAFHYVYRNLQTNYYDTETRTQQVINVGRVHGYGVESALSLRPSRFFDLYGNLTWTRTVTSGDRGCSLDDCGGLPNPVWASAGVANFHLPIGDAEAFLTGEWRYEGRRREAFDWRGITRRDGYASVNLRVGYRHGDRWEATIHVQNLFDSLSYGGALNGGDLSPANVWGASQPRNFGASLRYRFGS